MSNEQDSKQLLLLKPKPAESLSTYDSVYIAFFHTLPAVLLVLGRIFIGSGMSNFNFEKTVAACGGRNTPLINAISWIIILGSAVDTLIGRGTSIFLRCMVPKIYISNDSLDEDITLDEFDEQFPMCLWHEVYVITEDKGIITLYRRDTDKIKVYYHDDEAQKKIHAFWEKYFIEYQNSRNPITLSADSIQEFQAIKNTQQPPSWSFYANGLYYFLFCPSAATVIFSSLAAILYLDTFAKKLDSSLEFSLAFIFSGVIVNFLTYCYFNIRNINENITKICQQWQDGKSLSIIFFGEKIDHNVPQKNTSRELVSSIVLTIFGMIGNLSAAYYVMFKVAELPAVKTICHDIHVAALIVGLTLALLNVYGSFFSGIFNMSMNAHRIATEQRETPWTRIEILITANTIFLNAIPNAMQAFLGSSKISGQETVHLTSLRGVISFCLGVLIAAGYLFMSSGMMLQGNKRPIQYFNQQKWVKNFNQFFLSERNKTDEKDGEFCDWESDSTFTDDSSSRCNPSRCCF